VLLVGSAEVEEDVVPNIFVR